MTFCGGPSPELGIGSRRELRAALAQLGPVDVSA